MDNSSQNQREADQIPSNKDLEGNDKAPGEEKGKGEKVTNDDLKGKKVDRDPEKYEDQPIRQVP